MPRSRPKELLSFSSLRSRCLLGVAGGIKDVDHGDVVFATSVYGYESGKAEAEFLPRPNVGESTYDLIQMARAVAREPGVSTKSYDTFVAPIAAGEKVVASNKSETFFFLRRTYGDAVAVEMEGRGFLAATHANRAVQAGVIRGVSDLIENKAVSDRDGWQTTAARNAADFALRLLERLQSDAHATPPRSTANATTAIGTDDATEATALAELMRGAGVVGIGGSNGAGVIGIGGLGGAGLVGVGGLGSAGGRRYRRPWGAWRSGHRGTRRPGNHRHRGWSRTWRGSNPAPVNDRSPDRGMGHRKSQPADRSRPRQELVIASI